MTTVKKTERGFQITANGRTEEFVIRDFLSSQPHDVGKTADAQYAWMVPGLNKLQNLKLLGEDEGFVEAGPMLPKILSAAGIVPRPAAPASASPSPTPASTTASNPAPAAVATKAATPIASTTKPATPLAGSLADGPDDVAARTNGTRPSAANEQVLADHGWDPILAKLNHRRS